MQDLTKNLIALDENIEKHLFRLNAEQTQNLIKGILQDVADTPSRSSKIRATYMLERMAEVARDLEEKDMGFASRALEVFRWIDAALSHVAYMANPDSAGRYMEAFDQISIPVRVPHIKDPEEVRRRQELAAEEQKRLESALDSQRRGKIQEPKSGGNIIIMPDSY
jgi:hypothetical protein